MSIRVLLADGNDVMRPVIVKVLKEEPAVELVGEATSFAETLQMTAALKPDVLLLELHFDDERDLQQGSKVGVAGTPGFFVNGVFLSGARPRGRLRENHR
jgi:chemotaxis response regulator CheB